MKNPRAAVIDPVIIENFAPQSPTFTRRIVKCSAAADIDEGARDVFDAAISKLSR